jgi:hypothetical protein
MAVDATNPDAWRDSEIVVPRGTVHVLRRDGEIEIVLLK